MQHQSISSQIALKSSPRLLISAPNTPHPLHSVAQTTTMEVAALFVVVVFFFFWVCTVGGVEGTDSMILVRKQLGIDPNIWQTETPTCEWQGVRCDENQQVTSLNISGLPSVAKPTANTALGVISLPKLRHFNASGFPVSEKLVLLLVRDALKLLQTLDLRNSSLNGRFPLWVTELSNLSTLNMAFNSIHGRIPQTINNLPSLRFMDFSNNRLSGHLPTSVSSLYHLAHLDLSNNSFSGPLLPSIGNLIGLQFLNMEHNQFTGSIPRELKACTQLQVLKLDHNLLSGELPSELGSLKELQTVFLAFNSFSGVFPQQLTRLTKLRILSLAFNRFHGELPAAAVEQMLRWVVMMDLRVNYFSGSIPERVAELARVGRNCFTNVPRQHVKRSCDTFYRAHLNSSSGWVAPVPNSPAAKCKAQGVKNMVSIMAAAIGGIVLVLVVGVLIIFLHGRRRRRAVPQPPPSTTITTPRTTVTDNAPDISSLGESFTYDQLLQATNKFDRSNLFKVGNSGEFYKGLLPAGTQVVVKRINLSRIRHELYVKELEILGRVSHHPGIVSLIGYCLDRSDEKFLVYKLIPNGDLDSVMRRRVLPGNKEDQMLVHPLDWIARMKISLCIAEVLAFLHHQCSPPIVHRDIKGSSILLDDRFEVRLGSLSSAGNASGDHQSSLVTRLCSISRDEMDEIGPYDMAKLPLTAMGSWDQGDASSSSSTALTYDVYCFGKVLLEIVSGKANSMEGNGGGGSWIEGTLALINIHDKDALPRIVDPYLIVDEDLLEEVWAVAIIAKACLNPRPSKRPTMQHVVKALRNPRKIVKNTTNTTLSLRQTSSHSSWNEAFFGSWRSSTASQNILPGSLREEHHHRHPHRRHLHQLQSGNQRVYTTKQEVASNQVAASTDPEDVIGSS